MKAILFVGFWLFICSEGFSQTKMNDLSMAYYHNDSLKLNYRFYWEQDSIVKAMQTDFDMRYQKKVLELQDYIGENEKLASTGQLSQFQISKIQEEAQQKEQEIYAFQESETLRIQNETEERLGKITAIMEKLSKEFCEKKKIDILFAYSKEGQVTYMTPKLDVTREFIAYLNQHTSR